MSLKNIRVVLVSPIYSGNVGSVCRAMKNMGVTSLAIAAPRGSLETEDARKMSLHAYDVLQKRTEHATLAEAVADCGLVVGTSARQGLYRNHSETPRALAPRLVEVAKKTKVALVFGPEDNGLSNDDLQVCTQVVRIPSSPKYSSLNLAQAVMVCCYELFTASGEYEAPEALSPEAPSAMRQQMFKRWRESLLEIGFMKEDKADHIMLGLQRILSRGQLTIKDVRIMIGIARQTKWAGAEAKKSRARRGL